MKRLFLTGSNGAQSSAASTAARCNDHSMQRRVASLCCRVGSVAAERLPITHFYWVREPGPADCFLGIAAPPWGRNTAQQYRLWPERRGWTSRDRITEYFIWALTYQVDNVLNFVVLRLSVLMSGLGCFHWNPEEAHRHGHMSDFYLNTNFYSETNSTKYMQLFQRSCFKAPASFGNIWILKAGFNIFNSRGQRFLSWRCFNFSFWCF